jgi:hypothetical protein
VDRAAFGGVVLLGLGGFMRLGSMHRPQVRPPKLFNKLLGQLYHCLQHKQTFDGTSATSRGPRRVPRG